MMAVLLEVSAFCAFNYPDTAATSRVRIYSPSAIAKLSNTLELARPNLHPPMPRFLTLFVDLSLPAT